MTSNGNLTLKSDAAGTAAVGNSSGTIIGNLTIARYMPARRAWRLVTAPILSGTINQPGGDAKVMIQLRGAIPSGTYHLQLKQNYREFNTTLMIK